jgi:protein-S-isoprenylcysteine O-methyltransferase Ste14
MQDPSGWPHNPEARITVLRPFLRMTAGVLLLDSILGTLLFLPAGRLDWIEAWLFLAACGAVWLAYGVRTFLHDPDQLRERRRQGANTKDWDKVILGLYSVLLVILFPVCAWDAGRSQASPLPLWWKGFGWFGMALAGGLILRVMAANTFASRTARIQEDRGQAVVSGGPYCFVRHPMYLGIIVYFVCVPLALGSKWGLLPAAAICALFVVRTGLEDRMLTGELPGYAEYTRRTRYRLLPGIW